MSKLSHEDSKAATGNIIGIAFLVLLAAVIGYSAVKLFFGF